MRAGELREAAAELGLTDVELHDLPDGGLTDLDERVMVDLVLDAVARTGADGLIGFDVSAVACHPSQAVPGSVLWRRLEIQGDREYLRRLRE